MPQSVTIIDKIIVSNEKDAFTAAFSASACAKQLGFAQLACMEIQTAVSEIATNAVRYAGGGNVEIKSTNNGKVIEIHIEDKGEGITNIQQVQQDGFTTFKNSQGVGFSVARRSVDEFLINSEEGHGTTIVLKKFLPVSHDQAHYGVVSVADERYEKNGDAYVIKEYDGDKVLLAVIDGLGQGEEAEFVAKIAKKVIEECFRMSLPEIIKECDMAVRAASMNSGVALALALASKNCVYFAAIGDTHTKVFAVSNKAYTLSQPGLVGNYVLPSQIRVKEIPVEGGEYTVIMCTDGIKDNFTCEDIVINATAQRTAEFIFNTYHGSHGDATVLVAKIKDL